MAKINTNTQLDVTNKMSLSVGSSSNSKNYYEELYPWTPQLDLNDIIGETIPTAANVSEADTNVANNPTILEKITDHALTEVPAANGQAFAIYSTPGDTSSQRFTLFILPQKYGNGYTFSLKDGNNNIINLTDGAYQFDYNNGVLRFDDAHRPSDMGWTLPLKITAYRYIGKLLKDVIGGGSSGYSRKPADLLDNINTLKPTTNTVQIDGENIQDGDNVLFTNLSGAEASDNNKIFIASVSGTSVSWTLRTDGQTSNGNPTAGDQLIILKGNNEKDHEYGFNGNEWVLISGGSGSGSLTVEEEDGNPSGTNINKLVLSGGNSLYIDGTTAYLHAPPAPDPLVGTNLISDTTFYTGALSGGNINYSGTEPAGTVVDYIVNTANAIMTITHNANTYQAADVNFTKVILNGTDIAVLDNSVNFEESNRDGCQNINNYDNQGSGDPVIDGQINFTGAAAGYGDLKINSVCWTGNIGASVYQKGTAQIDITSASLWRQGYNEIILEHNSSQSNPLKVFYDIDTGADPNVTNADLTINTFNIKYLSGVNYYDTGTEFYLSADINAAFNNVYHSSGAPVVVDGFPNIASAAIMYNDASVSGVSDPPQINETMTITNYSFIVLNNSEGNDIRVNLTPRDPYGNYTTIQTPSHNYSVNSLIASSTATIEYFTDENYRFPGNTDFDVLPTNITGNFDSTISFASGTAGYDDQLQVYNEFSSNTQSLIYPSYNYSNGRQPIGPDYSAINQSIERNYYRIFQGTIDHTNGQVAVPGVTDADLSSGNIKIYIKVPTKTVWLDLFKDYNPATFDTNGALSTGVDGEGCRINKTVHSPDIDGILEFTLGTNFHSDSSVNHLLYIKVVYTVVNPTNKLQNGFGIINW